MIRRPKPKLTRGPASDLLKPNTGWKHPPSEQQNPNHTNPCISVLNSKPQSLSHKPFRPQALALDLPQVSSHHVPPDAEALLILGKPWGFLRSRPFVGLRV